MNKQLQLPRVVPAQLIVSKYRSLWLTIFLKVFQQIFIQMTKPAILKIESQKFTNQERPAISRNILR
jgi:hypothetical protein